jgi:hypothetical protein
MWQRGTFVVDVGSILIGASVTSGIGYFAYSYRNTIACTLTCISAELSIKEGRITRASEPLFTKSLTVERLDIKNYGFRRLQDVELHVPIRQPAVFVEVQRTSSISKSAVAIDTDDKIIRIIIPTLPRSEEMRINFATLSSYESEYREIRGTGGSYRVVEGKRHGVRRDALKGSIPIAIIIFGVWVLPMLIAWLGEPSKTPTTSPPIIEKSHP